MLNDIIQNIRDIFFYKRVLFIEQDGLFWRTLLQYLSSYVDSNWFVALSNVDRYASANSILLWRILFHSFISGIF